MTALVLNLDPILHLTDEQFYQLCQANQNIRFERTVKGKLIVMPPTGGETGKRSGDIFGQLWLWNKQRKLGIVFDSSTGFHLPNRADRSPDAAWVKSERWEALTPEQREQFPCLCPDLVVELRSKTDRLETLQAKMREYLDNGACLGWLIDPANQRVEVYRLGKDAEVLHSPTNLSGENVLPGFTLELKQILD